jgi:lysosomal alpha-mannosidase
LLIRLEHLQDISDDPQLSKPVTVPLKGLFSVFDIVSAKETTLGGNRWLEKVKRMDWAVESNDIDLHQDYEVLRLDDDFNVTLNPMQIRTFIVEVAYKKSMK